jgi:threonylcarbamoyladenosine tRNA methylthiotransferase MtaB
LPGGLRTLIEAILAETDLARLRLSSLEPWDIDETFFELWKNTRLCRQIHLPLQAGCDATLCRMGRPITTERFVRLVEAARAAIPDLAVTTDVLVGFPGEDDDAFRGSYQFVERIGFAKLHVFPYSPRPGTPATKLPHPVPRQVRDERARRMRELGALQRRCFQNRFLGRELEVLWERQLSDGRWTGWTDNYIRVVARAEADLCGRDRPARLLALEKDQVKGEVIL